MKKKFRKIHLSAGLLLVVYFLLGNSILAAFALRESWWEAFLVPFIYGSLACVVFLYIFSHESFFSFAKDLKKKQMQKEKKLLKKTRHYGRKLTVVAATIIGGPILGALTVRLLLGSMKNKYLFLLVANIPSTFFTLGWIRGAFHFFS